jgi:carbon storage regulator
VSAMLVLARKKGESIVLGDGIEVTVLSVEGETVKIGIQAPKSVEIYRKEIYLEIKQSNQESRSSRQDLSKLSQMIKTQGKIVNKNESGGNE